LAPALTTFAHLILSPTVVPTCNVRDRMPGVMRKRVRAGVKLGFCCKVNPPYRGDWWVVAAV
jgi:hypothetical protein